MLMSSTAFVYVVLTLTALFYLAEWLAPYDALAERNCRLGYVYDGDTVELKCRFENLTARLQGFDAPETKEPGCAEEKAHGALATDRLRGLLKRGTVEFRKVGTDKYDRALIRLTVNGEDVGDTLIREGLAVPYHGEARINWCQRLGAS